MYVLISNIGYIGAFVNNDDVQKINEYFKDLKFISLYFDHLDNQTGTNKVLLVRYKCGMIYFASDNYDMALIKHKELESIQQLYDDLFGVYGTNFGFSYEFEKLNNVEEIKKQLDTYN